LDYELDIEIENLKNNYNLDFSKNLENYNLKNSIDESFKFLDILNKFADTFEPWILIKDEKNNDKVT